MRSSERSVNDHSEGYQRAVSLIEQCCTEDGFLAATTDLANYRRVWGRDGCITGLGVLLSRQEHLIDCFRRTLHTLARHQGPHGEIPSNVEARTKRISYGGTAGRVDANLWFIIACGEYWKATGDDEFLEEMLPVLQKTRHLLGAWEFNNRGLLYIPPTGDWADEYVHSGYVLYDQILYWQVQKELCATHRHVDGAADHALVEHTSRLRHLIRANYWFTGSDDVPEDVYHEVLFEKGRAAAPQREGQFWMPFFSPLGYGYRFDAMANVLVSLLGVADDKQCDRVDDYISNLVAEETPLLPAFRPVITPKHEAWDELQMTFSHTFKNQPHEYHNGGLWPLVTGFYAASLARRGKIERAQKFLDAVHRANAAECDGESWSFPEFLHGQTHQPGGTMQMAWSAASAIIAEEYIKGKRLFIDE